MLEKPAIALLEAMLYPCRGIKNSAVNSVFHRNSLEMVIRNSIPYAPSHQSAKSQYQRPLEAFTIRWEMLSQAISQYGARNILDVGCAEGYMIRRAATERGVFAVGLERDWNRTRVGHAQAQLSEEYNYGIVPFPADSKSLQGLPTFDIVICFSVLHHVIRHNGFEEAHAFLKSLAGVTRKCLLFDMCSPEETANDPHWAQVLEFIKADVVGKTGELLDRAGFRNIKHIADTPGYVPPGLRPLFICEPPQHTSL